MKPVVPSIWIDENRFGAGQGLPQGQGQILAEPILRAGAQEGRGFSGWRGRILTGKGYRLTYALSLSGSLLPIALTRS